MNPTASLKRPTAISSLPKDIKSKTTIARPIRWRASRALQRTGGTLALFGRFGSGQAEFRVLHNILFDAKGRLVVADRSNMRIQILEEDGKCIGEAKQSVARVRSS
jgi:hypothetical protein